MIIRDKAELQGSTQDASGPGWKSLRMLVKSDGMGFSMNETVVLPGASLELQYKHHIEACYCISGEGTVVELDSGARHEIKAGVLYAPDAHDRHTLHVPQGGAPLVLISVFSPALQGDEVHGPDGSYAAPE